MSGDELDQAIDKAVRAMVAAEPAAGMRHRVLRRIAADEARPRAWRLAVALSAVLLCVAAAALVLRRPALDAPVATSAEPSQTAEWRPDADGGPASRPGEPTRPALRTPSQPSARGGAADSFQAASRKEAERPSTVEIAPLDPIGAIGVQPLSHDTVEMEAITIAAIFVEPLQVTALGPTDSSSTPQSTPR